jgi:hypothetical protein
MDYLIISRTRPGLTPDDYGELARRAKAFYGALPAGMTLKGNWAESGGSRTLALLAADDPRLIEAIQAPFRDLVEMEVIPLDAVDGFRD